VTTPDQPKPPTVLKFRSASGRTEIARRPDGTISLHVLAGHDVLADGDIVAAAAALVVGEEAAYERGVAAGRAQVERATDACPACTEESAFIDGHAHVTDYGYVLYDPQHRQDLAGGLVAEGRRQATEGWDREWAVDLGGRWLTKHPCDSEADARRVAGAYRESRTVVSRLVGPWEAAGRERESGGFELLPPVPDSAYPAGAVELAAEPAEQPTEPCGIKGPHPAHPSCAGWGAEQTQDGAR